MNVLWLSWKDTDNPLAGGAETISAQLMARLAQNGHSVRLITSLYPGAASRSSTAGVEIYRCGGRYSVYYKTFRLFRRTMADWPDIVIDEMNTIPFGAGFYSRKRTVLLAYQLARRIWFYQMALPFSAVGYFLEPVYLFIMSRRYKTIVTESDSTRVDLGRYGFPKKRVKVFRVGIGLEPLKSLEAKNDLSGILILGAMRPMKRTLSAVKGFEYAKDQNPTLKLTVAGDDSGPYAQKVLKYIDKSRHKADISVLGRVDDAKRLELMRRAALILVTSVKEGWGLIVTEANSQGTPAVVYDIDGLRDSVADGQTGRLVKSGDEPALGRAVNQLVSDKAEYERLRQAAWQSSKQ